MVAMDAVRGEGEVIDAVSAETAWPWLPASATSRSTPCLLRVARPDEPVGRPQHQVREGQHVDPHVEEGPAAELGVEQPARRRLLHHEAKVGVHLLGRSEAARLDPVADHPDDRVAGHPHGLHQEAAGSIRGLHHGFGLREVERQRLLAQHVLARVEGHPRVVEVEGVRGGDVHDVDLGVLDECFVRRVGPDRGPVADSAANALADSCDREPTAAISAPGTSRRSRAKSWAMRPVARIPQRVVSLMAPKLGRRPLRGAFRCAGLAPLRGAFPLRGVLGCRGGSVGPGAMACRGGQGTYDFDARFDRSAASRPPRASQPCP